MSKIYVPNPLLPSSSSFPLGIDFAQYEIDDSNTQTFDSGVVKIVDFNSAVVSNDNVKTGDDWKYTVPYNGILRLGVKILWLADNWSVNDEYAMFLYLNGEEYLTLSRVVSQFSSLGDNAKESEGTIDLKVNRGDTIQVAAIQITGIDSQTLSSSNRQTHISLMLFPYE